MAKEIEKRSNCPISYTLDFFGDKWTFLVMRDLAFKGKCFYKEFLEAGEGIATNILSDRLKRLEDQGIVKSEVFEALRTKKKYTLTAKGKALIPILVEIIVWGATYDAETDAGPEFVERAKNDREALIAEILAELE